LIGVVARVELNDSGDDFGICGVILVILSYIIVIFTFPLSICLCLKIIKEYERAVIFRLGRCVAKEPKGPGLFFILPCIDNIVVVDLRTVTFDVPPQEILTKDSVTVTVDAVVYFRIFAPISSVINVQNAQYSTRLLAATTLRNILGTKTLQDILQDREHIAHYLQEFLDTATDIW
jgi:erythrocyte band 7 integral membrane protein